MLNTTLSFIPQLPKELLIKIFLNLNPEELNVASQTNHVWMQASEDPIIWKALATKYFPEILQMNAKEGCPSPNYKVLFLERYSQFLNFYRQDFSHPISAEKIPYLLAALSGDIDKIWRAQDLLSASKQWFYALAWLRQHHVATHLSEKIYDKVIRLGLAMKLGDLSIIKNFWKALQAENTGEVDGHIVEKIPKLLADAVENGHVKGIEWILDTLCNENVITDEYKESHQKNMMINRKEFMNHIARHSAVLEWFLTRKEPEFKVGSEEIPDLFLKAARFGQLKAMKQLVTRGDCHGQVVEAFNEAGKYHHEHIIKWLLTTTQWRVNEDVKKVLFQYAARDNYPAAIRVFLANENEDKDKGKIFTAAVRGIAFITAAQHGNLAVIRVLLNHSIPQNDLHQGLDWALKNKYFAIVHQILECKADLVSLQKINKIYLLAAQNERYEIVELLKDISIETKDKAIEAAFTAENEALITWFLKKGYLETKNSEKGSLIAVKKNFLSLLKLLVASGILFSDEIQKDHLVSMIISNNQLMFNWYLENINVCPEAIGLAFELLIRKKDIENARFLWEKYQHNIPLEYKEKAFKLGVIIEDAALLKWFIQEMPNFTSAALREAVIQNKPKAFALLLESFGESFPADLKKEVLDIASLDIISIINQYESRLRMALYEKYFLIISAYLALKVNSFIKKPSNHPFLMGYLGALMILHTFGLFSLGVTASIFCMGFFSALICIASKLRDLYFEKSALIHKINLLEERADTPEQRKSFEDGFHASKGWKPYFTSVISIKNWEEYGSYAAGLHQGYQALDQESEKTSNKP